MSKVTSTFRLYHRYLGFFLAGIMIIYALSGILMIFRTTDFLKVEKQITREIATNVAGSELGRALFIRDFKVVEENEEMVRFEQGTYNKATGVAEYKVKELPTVLQKLETMHKATVNSPLFFLNIFFGISLLFFSVSAFFMFAKSTKIFKKGIYVAIGGLVFAIIVVVFSSF